jgi:putative ABC transport system permease protein
MTETVLHKQFILRQFTRSRKQALVFVLCVVLSIVTLIAINGFSISVNRALLKDARQLHAGDIIIHSHYAFSQPILDAVASLQSRRIVDSARIYEFYTVVRAMQEKGSLLAKVKVAEKGYPFYGRVELASGRPLGDVLTRGNIIVEQALLDRLNLSVGAKLHVGQSLLTIRDVLIKEPDRPVNFFSLGPRIFVSAEDIDALDLVKKGSRIHYTYLLKVHDEKDLNRIAAELAGVAQADQERVDTFRTARSGIKRFFDNFLFFLSLIGMFTLLLAGIGIQSALTAFLREKKKTIAIMKTVGATGRFITIHYIFVLTFLGLCGTFIGLWAGLMIQKFLPLLFVGLLPQDVKLVISGRAVFEGLGLGVLVVALFAFLPLRRLKDIKPGSIFRKEMIRSPRGLAFYFIALIIFLFFIAMVLWRLNDVKTGLYFVAGIILFILVAAGVTEVVLFLLKKIRLKSLVIRQAFKGLFRPQNATKPVIITMTASLAVIFSIYLIEQNLDAAFVQSYPPDAPNLFFLDIQASQTEAFAKTLGIKTPYYPIVRAKIVSVNGEPIDRRKERRRKFGDNLARDFNLTYRSDLLEDERIVKGQSLFRDDWQDVQVSVLDSVTEIQDMDIGDWITFRIQGIPLRAKISSIRTRVKEALQPYFYFVFPEDVLRDAPQTIFTAIRVEKEQISGLQNKIVARFPNVSVIDVTATVTVFANVMRKLTTIIRFFTAFSILAGILIIISSILATRFDRVQEAVYYKILGARAGFVLKVFTLENLFQGLISAILAVGLSQAGSWLVSTRLLDISYQPLIGASLLMMVATVMLVVLVGLVPSVSILRKKPVIFLREQTDE